VRLVEEKRDSQSILTWPICRKVDIWQMVIPNWIVQGKLVVSLSPVISNFLVAVDDEGVDSEHF
jgi:hypothetical protein